MVNIMTVLRSGYYIGKLLLAGVRGLVYLRWRLWRAKQTFKQELTKCGVPKDAADALALKYDGQNKQLISLLIHKPPTGRNSSKTKALNAQK